MGEDLPMLSPCLPRNTPEDPRTFLVVTTDPLEPSPEDTLSPPRSKTLRPVTAPSTSRSRTDVPPCLELPAAWSTLASTRATTTSSTPSPTTKWIERRCRCCDSEDYRFHSDARIGTVRV